MLILKPSQFEALRGHAEDSFAQRLGDHLESRYPEQFTGFSQQARLALVQRCIGRARRYGLTWERSLAHYVELMFATAPNFDEHPVIHAILSDGRIAPDARLRQVQVRVPAIVWERIVAQYDVRLWLQVVR